MISIKPTPILRKDLNADALFKHIQEQFKKVPDTRSSNKKIQLDDALMSGFAMFSLKDPSLLAFEHRRKKEDSNLRTIYGMSDIPSDTQMREILDDVNPKNLRPTFKSIFQKLQRGKMLEKYRFLAGHYLLSLDGTGFFSSQKLKSESCMVKKNKKTGKLTYYQQMLGAAIVHPDHKVVIPFAPEMIIRQDGVNKNDCERNAAKRFLDDFRREHPHLKVIVVEDGLSSNAPHIEDLIRHDCQIFWCCFRHC